MEINGVLSIETARARNDADKARRCMMAAAQIQADKTRRLFPVVIMEALQLDDAAEALTILEQLAGTASTLHMLASKCKHR